ncbi:molybdate ABC transporter substrate-binding protein [Actinomadura sediminis]|uniref:Molybdate ABC transporter substrate-binding protein n=1 Tax=Actinomadura sediminis TaxID=1038904 RepID=A0ABW3ELP8_9ACTN
MPDSPRRRGALACVPLALLALTAACGGSSGGTTLTVYAASSLTEVFGEMEAAYEHAVPDVDVSLVFGGSLEMAGRLSDLSPADVLVTADAASMNRADAHLGGRRRTVAHNSLTIAVAPGNPLRVRGVADLARPGLRTAAGAGSVPSGRYTARLLRNAGVAVRWTSVEVSARAVLDRVRAGEADAGVVYLTDMRAAGVAASGVPIPADLNVVTSYPAAVVEGGGQERAANGFVSWLTGSTARALFHKHGFPVPDAPQ